MQLKGSNMEIPYIGHQMKIQDLRVDYTDWNNFLYILHALKAEEKTLGHIVHSFVYLKLLSDLNKSIE